MVYQETRIILLSNSGYFLCHQFNIQQSHVLPHIVYLCFVRISEQRAIISLYNFNWLVFITEKESIYCAVRTESLSVIQGMCFVWISE